VIDGPGEYEIGGAFVYGRMVNHDEKQGSERGKNTMYLITIDGIDILHVGDLGHELSQEDIEKIPNVDILMVPVGGNVTIDAEKASELISVFEPAYVIPMHYQTPDLTDSLKLDGVDKFLDIMGVENGVKKDLDKLTISSVKEDSEGTEVVVLKPTH
jgi:L-ascorbate metabolism protein UlaG (beta-lactamase superfamily)